MGRGFENFYVVTGGPGAGKTTLLDRLARDGVATVPEAGRGVIQAQSAIDGPALPWRDKALFARLILGWELRSYREATASPDGGPVLFDRGIPDVIGYRRLEGLPIPDHLVRAAEACRYNPQVFVAPPWPAIYRQDAERRQDLETAERTYAAMAAIYTDLGYALTELPRTDVETRAAFVAARIGR
ncbi:MAG: AAA family ATPase [Alphaproteobacteria bacterium]